MALENQKTDNSALSNQGAREAVPPTRFHCPTYFLKYGIISREGMEKNLRAIENEQKNRTILRLQFIV